MTLADFLLARIAEDEASAKTAIADDGGADEGFANQYDRLVGTHGRPLDFVPRFGEAAAQLIVRFAVPARVLAECAAKRRIVVLHGRPHRCRMWDLEGVTDRREPCDTLRLLAVPYADHPDYREEWAVVSNDEALTEFLLARIAEDEAYPWQIAVPAEWRRPGDTMWTPTDGDLPTGERLEVRCREKPDPRWMAECEAKRRIVAVCSADLEARGDGALEGMVDRATWDVLAAMAAVYADHPDYREEWRQ